VIFDSLMGMFSLDMGIDLGTCNTLVCVKGQGGCSGVERSALTRTAWRGNCPAIFLRISPQKSTGSDPHQRRVSCRLYGIQLTVW